MSPSTDSNDERDKPIPVSIQRDADDSIVIHWSDEKITRRTAVQLRNVCPCATCREKKRGESSKPSGGNLAIGLPILSKAEARPLRVESMNPVGSYAYNISFSDGHSSGIFPFALLHDETKPDAS